MAPPIGAPIEEAAPLTDPRLRSLVDLPIWQGRLARVVVETPRGSGTKSRRLVAI